MDYTYFNEKGAAWKTYNDDDRVEWMAVIWREKQPNIDDKMFDDLLADGSAYDIVVEDVIRDEAMSELTTALDDLMEAVNG
jgi:hypothetical protein